MNEETDTPNDPAPDTDAEIMNTAEEAAAERPPKTPADLLRAAAQRGTGLDLAMIAILTVLAGVGVALVHGGMRACFGALWLTICALLLTDYVRRFRAFTIVREFIRHPPSVFWIHAPEAGPLAEIPPFRWFHAPRALVFHPVSGAAPAVVAISSRRHEQLLAYCRERNPEAVAFSPERR